VAIEAANRSAFVHHCDPVGERLDGVGGTVGEIRQVMAIAEREEPDDAVRVAAAMRPR